MELRPLTIAAYVILGLLLVVSIPEWVPTVHQSLYATDPEAGWVGWVVVVSVAAFLIVLVGWAGLFGADAADDYDAPPVTIAATVALTVVTIAAAVPLAWLVAGAVTGFYWPLVMRIVGGA